MSTTGADAALSGGLPGTRPKSWAEVPRPERRREIVETSLALAIVWVLIVGIYYLIPFADLTEAQAITRLVLGLTVFVVVFAGQLRRVIRSDFPGLRAVQALGGAIPLFIVVFASVYLSLSHASVTALSEPLNHTGALYFVVTIFSTVGFGDITPKSDLARILVSVQMVLDLVVIGVVAKLLLAAAKTGRDG